MDRLCASGRLQFLSRGGWWGAGLLLSRVLLCAGSSEGGLEGEKGLSCLPQSTLGRPGTWAEEAPPSLHTPTHAEPQTSAPLE